MISQIDMKKEQAKGFTLLELLIVIAIIAILSVALVIVLNPAETLKKTRDTTRIADLGAIKTALGLYMTSTSTPFLGPDDTNELNNDFCKATPSATVLASTRIFYSLPIETDITDGGLDGGTTVAAQATAENLGLTGGAGWIPVNFDTLIGGSPISHIPRDPTNTVADLGDVANTDLVYRYACSIEPLAFEINAQLESTTFTTAPDDKEGTDGGNNTTLYEVGTNLLILGEGTDF